MWPLLKADFQYTRIGLGIIAVLVAFFFYQHAAHDGWSFYTFVVNTTAISMITMGIMAGGTDKERRDRTFMSLPLPIAKVGLARLIYVPIMLACLMVVWSIFLIVRPQSASIGDVWMMFNVMSLAFVVFTIFALHHDLSYHNTRRYRMVMYAVGVLFVAVLGVVGAMRLLDDLGVWYTRFLTTFLAVVVHFAVAALSLILQLRAFAGRSSYLS